MKVVESLLATEVLHFFRDPVIILDTAGEIQYINSAFEKLLGYDSDEVIGTNIVSYLVDSSIFESCMNQVSVEASCENEETLFRHKNGEIIATIKSVQLISQERLSKLFVNLRDVSRLDHENKALNQKLHITQDEFNDVLNSVDDIIWYVDDQSMDVKFASEAVETIFGISKATFISQPSLWQAMIHQDDKERVMQFFMNMDTNYSQTIEFRIMNPDGSLKWLNNKIIHKKELNYFIGITSDITDAKKNKDTIEFMAYHDALTSLPNRTFLKERIEEVLERCKTVSSSMAVLFLDLDNFKFINDSMGHEVGDKILIELSHRLINSVDKRTVVSRFGGDEFIILLTNIQNQNDIELTTQQLIDTISKPFVISGHEYFVSSSIGISTYPDNSDNSSALIRQADTAMYMAKKSGKNRYEFYTKNMENDVSDFIYVERMIRDALKYNHFELYFQPLMCAKTHKLRGFEALLRLINPVEGFISPEVFIPVAEKTGDILAISNFVMREAFKFNHLLNLLTSNQLYVAINISAKQFTQPNFTREFLRGIREHHVDAQTIKVELTESVVMKDITLANTHLDALKEAGVKTALDDFGTGYSSFEYLAKLPIDTIKIDKSFVIELFSEKSNQHIITAMTTLAHTMNMDVIAEGVESLEHAEFLEMNGVDVLQGFYFNKAMRSEEIFESIKAKKVFFELDE